LSTPSRRKGTTFESAVRDYLNSLGVFSNVVQRAPLWGASDAGDLLNTGEWTFEVKNCKTITLADFVDQAEKEAKNAGTRWGAAVIKRRNKSTRDAYVVMSMAAFTDMIGELPVELRS
jgi:hypothetical protein